MQFWSMYRHTYRKNTLREYAPTKCGVEETTCVFGVSSIGIIGEKEKLLKSLSDLDYL